ncbi:MAG: sigma-70 family RNA polymerase sigma factor [Solirubrobacteraceae bacterium]
MLRLDAHAGPPQVPDSRSAAGGESQGRLSTRGERALVCAAVHGGEADRARLLDAYMPLIARVAQRYRHAAGIDREELLQEGVVGVLRALDRYDPRAGTPFWAYASWWVRQAMQQLVSELACPVVLSDRAARQLARVREAERRFEQARGRAPRPRDIAEGSGLPRGQVERLIAAGNRPRGLEERAEGADGPGATALDVLADPRSQDAYDRVRQRLTAAQLPALLRCLTPRERAVIRHRFGLSGHELTLREIARGLGVSAERVRQIEAEALGKLRVAAT